MLKHTFYILLALVMACFMTGCTVTDTNIEVSTTAATELTINSIEETSEENIDNFNINNAKIKLINPTIYLEMPQEEISAVMTEMVNISFSKTLSISEMIYLGRNFYNIFSFAPNVDTNDFVVQSTKAFNSVYIQCIKQQIPLEEITCWTNIPVAEIQLKYFSGKFSSVENVDCKALYHLPEDDAVRVAETIISNPALFEKSAFMVYDFLMCPHHEVQKIGLSILTHISEISQPIDSSIVFNFCRILDTNSIVNSVLSLEKLNEIRNNIIRNQNLDFVAKYYVFCNTYDEDVSNWAHSALIEVAKNSTAETAKDINELIDFLCDDDLINQLVHILDSKDF